MELIHEPFTKEEYDKMKLIKDAHDMSWHDMILFAILDYDK